MLLGLSQKPSDWRKESMNWKEIWTEYFSFLPNTWPFQSCSTLIFNGTIPNNKKWLDKKKSPSRVGKGQVRLAMRPCVHTVQHYQMQLLRQGVFYCSLNDPILNRWYPASTNPDLRKKNASQTKMKLCCSFASSKLTFNFSVSQLESTLGGNRQVKYDKKCQSFPRILLLHADVCFSRIFL